MDKILNDDAVVAFESVIRSMAATVVTSADTRKYHPSYGMTKGLIRTHAERMAGAIGAYMVMTRQANHNMVWRSATFTQPHTAELVDQALTAVAAL